LKKLLTLVAFSVLLLVPLVSQHAFAGIIPCEERDNDGDGDIDADDASFCVQAIGGEIIPLDTTMVLVAGTQTTAAWMIPVIVSGIGIAVVIARKF